jgi:micrococcal nuclease
VAVRKTVLKLNFFKPAKFFAIFFIATKAYSTLANASNTWQGIVTHVTDGDTLRVRPVGSTGQTDPLRVRIDGIDAPESCQLYGAQSTAALKKLVASKSVTILSKRFDEYGRDVAKITVNNVDVGGWMVSKGHAWSYHYRHSAGPYRVEEESAARARLGLFADAAAIEPRIFRREHGSCHLPKDASKASDAGGGGVQHENLRKRHK